MPQTYLIFDASVGGKPTAQIKLTGVVAVSPLVELNGQAYLLRATYTHSDGDIDNLYVPASPSASHDNLH